LNSFQKAELHHPWSRDVIFICHSSPFHYVPVTEQWSGKMKKRYAGSNRNGNVMLTARPLKPRVNLGNRQNIKNYHPFSFLYMFSDCYDTDRTENSSSHNAYIVVKAFVAAGTCLSDEDRKLIS
jgi:hypothetical protein